MPIEVIAKEVAKEVAKKAVEKKSEELVNAMNKFEKFVGDSKIEKQTDQSIEKNDMTKAKEKFDALMGDDKLSSLEKKVDNSSRSELNENKESKSEVSEDKVPEKPEDYRRPYLRKEVVDEIYARAPKDKQGRYLDPNTGKPIEGKPDIGHKPGHEHWREAKKAFDEGLTQKQFNDRMNNPDYYQLEDPSNNRSHKFEDKSEYEGE